MTKTIRTQLNIPTPLSRMGRTADKGVPFRALEAYLDEIKAALPDDAERKTCILYGTEHLRAEYDNVLTPVEELEERIKEMEDVRGKLKGMLPPEGAPLSADDVARLRQLLG